MRSQSTPALRSTSALSGTAADLDVTGADYYRLPAAAIAQDEVDPATGALTHGEIGWAVSGSTADTADNGDSKDPAETGSSEETAEDARRGKTQKRRSTVKFVTGSSWMRISFPSAKDPSFEACHGKVTTCVVTVEADDDFAISFETKPKIFMIKKATSGEEMLRLYERVKKDLLSIYPQLEGKKRDTSFLQYRI